MVRSDDSREMAVTPAPVVHALQEILVAGADFATNVMRKIIKRKQ